MIARVTNLWAALKFAWGNERPEELALDAEGQQKLERLLSALSEQGKKIDESQIEMAREVITSSQRWEKLLADPDVEAAEIVRQINERDWKIKICENRKSIRFDCWLILLLAVSSIALHLFVPENWWSFLTGFLAYLIVGHLFRLDSMWLSEQFKRVQLKAWTAAKQGDNHKAEDILKNYSAKWENKTI